MPYKSLAAHNSACNSIYYRFQDCENEHPYRRFFGHCGDILREMNKCIKEQREIRREESAQYRKKIQHGMKTEAQEDSSD